MATSRLAKYTKKLEGVRVLVIGGTSGIGFGVAEALLENGASSIIVSSSSQERVDNALRRLEHSYPAAKGKVEGIVCNLGSQEHMEVEVKKLFLEVSKGGKLDHVVHTAGDGLAIGNIEDFTLKEIQQAGMVRFFSPMIVAQHIRQNLKDGPASSYILTTGGGSHRPQKEWAVIQSYLTGLEGMSRALARDLAPVRVNLVGPGPVETELWDSFKEAGQFDAMMAGFKKSMATETIGKVEDVVESYLYLMKDHNITGHMIYTNGGFTLI